jgi:hypothetical protein
MTNGDARRPKAEIRRPKDVGAGLPQFQRLFLRNLSAEVWKLKISLVGVEIYVADGDALAEEVDLANVI